MIRGKMSDFRLKMKNRAKNLFTLVTLQVLWASFSLLFGPTVQAITSLEERNPFLLPNATAAKAEEKVYDALESVSDIVSFQGSYKLSGDRVFSLRFLENGQNRWMKLEDSFRGIKVLQFVEGKTSLLLEYEGNRGLVKLSGRSNENRSRVLERHRLVNEKRVLDHSIHSPKRPPPQRMVRPPSVVPKRVRKPEVFEPPRSDDRSKNGRSV